MWTSTNTSGCRGRTLVCRPTAGLCTDAEWLNWLNVGHLTLGRWMGHGDETSTEDCLEGPGEHGHQGVPGVTGWVREAAAAAAAGERQAGEIVAGRLLCWCCNL